MDQTQAGQHKPPADDLEHRFAYHRPDADRAQQHADVRTQIFDLADWLNDVLPAGREKALVITKLEEAMFWANAAIARQR